MMQNFEYKVVPAPNRGEKAPGVKTAPDRFAHALASLMNELALDGWEYQRAETLPSEERTGLTKRTTVYHSVLVFRRAKVEVPKEAPRRLLTTEAPQGKAPPLRIDDDKPEPKVADAPEPNAEPEIEKKPETPAI